MVAIRRYLHERPELSFHEVHTPAYIAKFHRELGLEVREHVGERGVVATLVEGNQVKQLLCVQILMHLLFKSLMMFRINQKMMV